MKFKDMILLTQIRTAWGGLLLILVLVNVIYFSTFLTFIWSLQLIVLIRINEEIRGYTHRESYALGKQDEHGK